jgi:hypothetical protein
MWEISLVRGCHSVSAGDLDTERVASEPTIGDREVGGDERIGSASIRNKEGRGGGTRICCR